MQNIIRQTSSGALGLPIARANGSEPNIAIAVPIRPAATFSPKANARAFPRNHLTTTLLAVMPTISMPTPNIAKPSVAYSTCDLSENTCHEPMLSDVTAPPKSVETAQYLSSEPAIISPTESTPVKRGPFLSRIIPPKISISRKMLNQP